MKKKYLPCIFILFLGFLSCERGELLNSEADIEAVILPNDLLVGASLITNNAVKIPKLAVTKTDSLKLEEQLRNLTLEFKLTEGATISPSPNEPHDYTKIQKFTVTSQDGNWSKEYEIIFHDTKFDKPVFSFEYARLDATSSYYEIYEYENVSDLERNVFWASGNPGFKLTAAGKLPTDYPTVHVAKGKTGNGVKLETRSTGSLGELVKMPLAAGNLFLGNFDVTNALISALKATRFGLQTTLPNPKSLNIWCKYEAGSEFTDKNKNVLDKTDTPSIYAVFYEPEKDSDGRPVLLDGTNIKTAPNIISIAEISAEQIRTIRVDDVENADYQFISIPFEYKLPFDEAKQLNGEYYFTIVMSSSTDGDLFEGAVGSTLYVDEVELILE